MITNRRLFSAALATLAGLIAFTPRPQAEGSVEGAIRKRRLHLRKWQCTNDECEPYVYDPSIGDVNVVDPENPIPPGVAFQDLPDSWRCPICRDPKSDFEPLDEWVIVEVPA